MSISAGAEGSLRLSITLKSCFLPLWVDDIEGVENLGKRLLQRRKDEKLPVFTPPEQTVEALLESGYSLIKEHQLIIETSVWYSDSFSDCGLKRQV
ncbi:hypothetical protein POPTR_003G187601v4 [Populus trichocarpa]|uniref:Protein kinase domain-containing protein n=1 Tax=Populus trichocarpa TaxID=3694 RepID=B9GXN3_POPTR|nr:hypothetical protein POPTR_003G187601v4 [Populus trichocarpa]